MMKVWTVSELTEEIGQMFSKKTEFQNCWVSGELSNFKNHRPSGHWYFTLKDEYSNLKGVMFRTRSRNVRFSPADGMKVLVRGNLRIYERDGNIQLYAEEMQPSGLGELYLAFEQLKIRLAAEGLFAQELKKPIPRFPGRIGIVTSQTGAALRDIITVMQRRHPGMSWILAPAAVQGESAPAEIARAISLLNKQGNIDVLIVGRGGGSLEELWAFNTEEVARAIVMSRIPVISAVGHETDITIADLVADLRAPTPSAAAELAIPLLHEMQDRLLQLTRSLALGMRSQLQQKRNRVEALSGRASLQNPYWRLIQSRQELDVLAGKLQSNMTRFVADKDGILKLLTAKLDLLSPLAILGRGYSIAYGSKGNLLRSTRDVNLEEEIKVRLAQGSIACRVLAKEN
ncbi:MAG: exodeoxyribonuclease VII large subunit [Desulfitobacteriaceae bacterium]|nr:exodeoxyribonuclease VII large subunit [Desulfitobacteriaceae bacterium]MDD4401078.1 exodeoxyribonuclease VII large subunit [Desulfitobacteriaceae bacterium]